MKRFLRKEAAAYIREQHGLPCTPNTLQKYATTGGGPEYQIFGNRAIYTDTGLDSWVEKKLTTPRSCTSGAAA